MSAEPRSVSRTGRRPAIAAVLALAAVFAAVPAAAQTRRPPQEPARPASPAAPTDSLEARFWNAIRNSETVSDFRTYLDAYPDGQFSAQARDRLRQLEGRGAAVPAAPGGGLVVSPANPRPPTAPAGAAGDMRDCQQCPRIVPIPAGSFSMGSAELFPFEAPVHQVNVRKPFYIGQREVTFEEWDACVAEGGCAYSPPDRGAGRGGRPVTNVSWTDVQAYIVWLSKKSGKPYRLPSESEWEYAARAGSTSSYPWGQAMEKNRANCAGCNAEPSSNTIETGTYPPNDFGLYDMQGNAAEWVADCWNDSFRAAPADGSVWDKPRCQERVLRGGSFNNDPRYLRSASRFKYDFDVRFYSNGFRVARDN